jgi:hypothetical protein
MLKSGLLENLIKSSHKNTEILLQTYFDLSSDNITDDQIQDALKIINQNIFEMQAEINHQIVSYKQHR